LNTLENIREKLRLYDKKIIEREFIEKILTKFAPNYSVTQISNLGLISPLKRGKYYFNNLGRELVSSYSIGGVYMKWEIYAFWWLSVYNMYGFTTQVAEWYTVYNTKISGKKVIWTAKFIFKRQRESFFYGIEMQTRNTIVYSIMTPERAFIERLKEWFDFSSLPQSVDSKKLLSLSKNNASGTIISKIEKLCL
jgi:hypothetical protein